MFAMTNNQPTFAYIGFADPALQVVGIGDFNADGTSDILLRDPVGGGLCQFVMQNNQPIWAPIGTASPALHVTG